MTSVSTDRGRAKDERRRALTEAAATLFSHRGFAAVSLAEIGREAGVSGPAVYRHFAGKQDLLDDLLVGVSDTLQRGGQAVVAGAPGADVGLDELIAFHVHFALTRADVIRVQDRDLASASESARREVRRLQSAYAQQWIDVLGQVRPDLDADERRLRVHAGFGLINSTPHSVRAVGGADDAGSAAVLRRMAAAALLA